MSKPAKTPAGAWSISKRKPFNGKAKRGLAIVLVQANHFRHGDAVLGRTRYGIESTFGQKWLA